MKQILLTMTALFMLSANCIFAQVTIGDLKDPESFSILELEGGGTRGLRLPQLSTQERNDMQVTFGAKTTVEAVGLQIFNTTTGCVETWNGVEWIQKCAPIPITNAHITTFTNVMYDFQKQTLEAYNDGSIATKFVWEYSTNGTDFVPVPGAPNSRNYTVPAHFADTYFTDANEHSKEISFRCKLSNPSTSPAEITSSLGILFINTNTAGYGTDATTGVKYATLQSGNSGGTVGGAFITNNTNGAKVFLPAASVRANNNGTLLPVGVVGLYNASTYYDTNYLVNALGFNLSVVNTNCTGNNKSGYSVRCVQ
ncbi:MAG: hypothetical protein LBJ17_06145 [Dysgonamonadaceae bacterium]|jgi:hypothetical protein|nr:hypothetical protein [Dysgonamonadaceae bacterium]